MMAGRTLVDEIITLIQSEANNNPAPKVCKIISNYGAKPYSDVEVEDLGKLTYIRTIGSTKVGLEGLICFLNGDLNQGVVITSEELHFNEKLGFNQESSDKFNFAIITKSDKYITYE